MTTPKFNWNCGSPEPVDELRIPITFHKTPDASGLYIAYYVTLKGGSRPYGGFQPKPSEEGKHTIQAVFSSFSAEAKHNDPDYCVYGADGGAGVSCSARFNAELGKEYTLVLTARDGNDDRWYYDADLFDGETAVTHVGSFNLPADGTGRFRPFNQGFIERYIPAGCNQIVEGTFGRIKGILNGTQYEGTAVTQNTPGTDDQCITVTYDIDSETQKTDFRVSPKETI